MQKTANKQGIYSDMLIGLTLLDALVFYCFGMLAAINFVVYLIYLALSTTGVYFFIFSIKKRRGIWWVLLLTNIYLTVHPLLLCLLIGILREAHYGKIFY